jgi:anti-anti-sigma regulatory factor
MPFSITNKPDGQLLKLEGAVTVQHAQQLATVLVEGLRGGRHLGVDTAGLVDIDTCVLQLLQSVRKTVPALSFENPSEVFISAVERCGLRRELLCTQEEFLQ